MVAAGELIVDRLRKRIVRGKWKAGMRLPAQTRLIKELGSCANTVHAAKQLAAEGSLKVGARKKATRVAANPPHLSHNRLIFPKGVHNLGQFSRSLYGAGTEVWVSRGDIAFDDLAPASSGSPKLPGNIRRTHS